MLLEELRHEVCKSNLILPKYGLVVMTSGNISGRDPETGLVVMKPSGYSYDEMTQADMVVLDLDGKVVEGDAKWEKRLGGRRVLVPTPLLVDAEIRKVRKGKLVTVNQIRDKLARDFRAEATCPMTTGIFLRIISEAAEEDLRNGKKRITPYWRVLKSDGRVVGRIRSMRTGETALKEAKQGDEVAVAITNVTVGRQIHENETLLINLNPGDARKLFSGQFELTPDEEDVLHEVAKIKRQTDGPFWGR